MKSESTKVANALTKAWEAAGKQKEVHEVKNSCNTPTSREVRKFVAKLASFRKKAQHSTLCFKAAYA